MLVKMQGENNMETKLDNLCFKCHSVFRRYRMKKLYFKNDKKNFFYT